MLHNGVACEAAAGSGNQHSLPPQISANSANKACQRGLQHPWSWFVGLLTAILGGTLLLSSRFDGGRALAGLRLSRAGMGAETPRIKVARSRDAGASGPGRLFRHYGDVARIPGNQSASTYEQLWPGYTLFHWAGKTREFQHLPPPPEGRSVCLVHVGKTAGSSIGCALGFRLHCDSQRHLPGQLPKLVTHIFHSHTYDCPRSTDFYLFVVRDPLARMRSAFVYGRQVESAHEGKKKRHADKIYLECPFLSIDELASLGLAEGGAASAECKRRARDMLRGNALYASHAYYNFQYYVEMIPHGADILVIRTEHMEEDWRNVERELGGAAEDDLTFPHDNAHLKYARDAILGAEERRLLCRELCVEIQYYKLLLRRARNLDAARYAMSLGELRGSCPDEARRKQCEFHTPNIKFKLLDNLGHRGNATRGKRSRPDNLVHESAWNRH